MAHPASTARTRYTQFILLGGPISTVRQASLCVGTLVASSSAGVLVLRQRSVPPVPVRSTEFVALSNASMGIGLTIAARPMPPRTSLPRVARTPLADDTCSGDLMRPLL